VTVTPTSSMARAVSSVISLVAASATFQARVGAANATEARAHIYGHEAYIPPTANADEGVSGLRPFAVVDIADRFEWLPMQMSCFIRLDVAGDVVLVLEDNARETWINDDSEPSYSDSFVDFLNFAGGVADDMNGKLSDATYDSFGFQSVRLLSPPTRSMPEDRGNTDTDHWFAVFAFTRDGNGGGG
jgi:hypothetical protein